jgi:hypothetical protein
MANTIPTPYMNLPNPVPGVDPGPDWATNLYNCNVIVDQHTHVAGSGQPITPSAININADLTFNNFNITSTRSVRFYAQSATLSGGSDIDCVYVSGVDLYYNDGNGTPIRITSGGNVIATSSGIVSGTATASFSGSVLVVNAASLTPANIQGASILIGNNVANSNYVTLSPVNSLGASYTLVLPTIPSVKSIVTIDTSGNIAAQYTVDNSTIVVSSNVIKVPSGGIAQANLYTRTVSTTATAGNVGQSPTSGFFTTTSSSPVNVTGASFTLVCTGRPVVVMIMPGSINGYIKTTDSSGSEIGVSIDGTIDFSTDFGGSPPIYPCMQWLASLASGSHTFQMVASTAVSGQTVTVSDMTVMAYEI